MSKDIKERVNGKAFISALDKCQTTKEVLDLLQESMDRETLKDRVNHVNDSVLINNLMAQKARVNILSGCRASHGDLAIMGAHKFCTLTEKSDDMVKSFKERVNLRIRKDVLSANRDKYRASKTAVTVDNSMEM